MFLTNSPIKSIQKYLASIQRYPSVCLEIVILPYLSHFDYLEGLFVVSGRLPHVLGSGIMHGDKDEAIPLEASVAWDGADGMGMWIWRS